MKGTIEDTSEKRGGKDGIDRVGNRNRTKARRIRIV